MSTGSHDTDDPDATRLRRRAVSDRRTAQAVCAWFAVLTAYVVAYGNSIGSSMSSVLDRGKESHVTAEFETYLTRLILVSVIALILIAVLRWGSLGQWVWAKRRAPAATVLGAGGSVLATIGLAYVAIIPVLKHLDLINSPDVTRSVATEWVSAVSAGLGEELIVLAAPVTVLRFYRVRASVALPLLVVIRVLYHLYYGWAGVWWLVPWAVVSAMVYWRWRDVRLLMLLIGLHIVVDAQVSLFGDAYVVALCGIAACLIAAAFLLDRTWFRAEPSHTLSARMFGIWPQPRQQQAREGIE